jgi:hypothetical protein
MVPASGIFRMVRSVTNDDQVWKLFFHPLFIPKMQKEGELRRERGGSFKSNAKFVLLLCESVKRKK